MCTLETRGNLFILTLTGETEHRLNPTLIASIRSALSQAKSQVVEGSVLITFTRGRFFSNGFDLDHAQAVAKNSSVSGSSELLRMTKLFEGVVADYLSLPMPTIAAVTGHAAASGLILAICHDYVMMMSSRVVMYMSELDLGMTLPDYFMALIRAKVGSGSVGRDLVLRACKVRGEEALRMGIADAVYGSAEEVVDGAVGLGEELGKRGLDGKAYREIRKSLYPEVCRMLGLEIEKNVMPSKL